MTLRQITPPKQAPLSLDECLLHCRVDRGDFDPMFTAYITVALQALDGPDGLLGRCLIARQWDYTCPRFEPVITLPLPPVQAIDAITWEDGEGTGHSLPASAFRAANLGSLEPATIRPASGLTWPAELRDAHAVIIRFTAGFGPDPADVPAPIRQAIKMHVAHLFDHPGSVIEVGYAKPVPQGYDELVRPYRVWSF